MKKPIVYKGVDRCPWGRIENVIYGASELQPALARFEEHTLFDEETGLTCASSLELCLEVCESFGVDMSSVQIILFRQLDHEDQLEKSKECLGIDIWVPGEWSLIKEGVFRHLSSFPEFIGLLNQNGLFDSRMVCDEYVKSYLDQAHLGLVEDYSRYQHPVYLLLMAAS